MPKSFAFFREGLVTYEDRSGRWNPASPAEEDYAIDVLNGYKPVAPTVRYFRRLEVLPQPSGVPVSPLIPLLGILVLGTCAAASGAPVVLTALLTASVAWGVGKLVHGDSSTTN